jgi:phosphogluconate dehydratase
VALVTDGRMSGASGKIPAAIHMSPEAAHGGPIARVQDGDVIRLDGEAGRLELKVDPAVFATRTPAEFRPNRPPAGLGREMFDLFRMKASSAATGASPFSFTDIRS